jgi:hypothetical protein
MNNARPACSEGRVAAAAGWRACLNADAPILRME